MCIRKENQETGKGRAVQKLMAVCLLLCTLLCGCSFGKPALVIGSGETEGASGGAAGGNVSGAPGMNGSTPAGAPGINGSALAGAPGMNGSALAGASGMNGSAPAGVSGRTGDSAGVSGGEADQAPDNVIYVYVCGAVAEQGVVKLPEGSRADDAVKAAGGMTGEADVSYVNLAAKVSDGEKLFVPTREEAEALAVERQAQESGLVDINTADAAALCTLPGIGESRAADIIAYRKSHGGFTCIEDIKKVPGIKDAAFEKLRDKIAVGQPVDG